MDEDPLQDLLVKVSGTIEGDLPATWTKPMSMAHYPKFSRQYGTNMYGEVEGARWYVFVEKDSEVQIYLFNDANNNNSFDWPYEPRIPAPQTAVASLKISNDDIDSITIPIRKVSGSISSIPAFFVHPIVSLVYPDSNGWPALEMFATVSNDGTFEVYGTALTKYKMWIISDVNGNNVYDYPIREPYVTIPERESKSLKEDTKVIDLTTGNATINATLGSLEGTIQNNNSWEYPQAALYQGWDIMAYNSIDSNEFKFCFVNSYKINNDSDQDPSYKILLFDDDNPHDGIYVYDNESDEMNVGPDFTVPKSNITRSTNE